MHAPRLDDLGPTDSPAAETSIHIGGDWACEFGDGDRHVRRASSLDRRTALLNYITDGGTFPLTRSQFYLNFVRPVIWDGCVSTRSDPDVQRGQHLCGPDTDSDTSPTAADPDTDQDDVLPGRSVCPPGWVNLSRRGTAPYCHPAPDLSRLHHAARTPGDVSGPIWGGGCANADRDAAGRDSLNTPAGDVPGQALGGY